jgi:hypothetical protein
VVYGNVRLDAVERVVAPVTTGENSALAAELVPAFTEWFGASARLVTVVNGGLTPGQSAKAVRLATETARESGLDLEPEILHDRDVGRGLIRSIRRKELVVVGAPSTGPITPIFGQTVPGVIATSGRAPVVVVRGVEPQKESRFERVFFRQG